MVRIAPGVPLEINYLPRNAHSTADPAALACLRQYFYARFAVAVPYWRSPTEGSNLNGNPPPHATRGRLGIQNSHLRFGQVRQNVIVGTEIEAVRWVPRVQVSPLVNAIRDEQHEMGTLDVAAEGNMAV